MITKHDLMTNCLRSQHISTFSVKIQLFSLQNINKLLMLPETVDHFLLDCGGCQNDMIKTLDKNNVKYNEFRNKLKDN